MKKQFFFVLILTLIVAGKELCATWPPVLSFKNKTDKALTVVLSREDIFQELRESKTLIVSVRQELLLPAKEESLLELFRLSGKGMQLMRELVQKAAMNYETRSLRPRQTIKTLKIFCADTLVKEITQDHAHFEIMIKPEDITASDE
ncbi:MAG: hypothetical protein Q8Q25_00615 [bacterium]|nr:hypothetical protein [bacterium]